MALFRLVLALPLIFAQNHILQNNSVLKPDKLHRSKKIKDSDTPISFLNKQIENESENREICEFGKVLKLESKNFNSHIAHGNFFIKFYSPSCVFCRLFRPIWLELASDLINETKVCIAEYNCNAEMKLCKELSVKSVPTLILFKDGQNVEKYKGNKNKRELRNYLTSQTNIKNLEDNSAPQRNFLNISIALWLIYIVLFII